MKSDKQTTIVVGAGDAGALAHLEALMKIHHSNIEVITTDEAAERDLTVPKTMVIDYMPPPLVTVDYFKAPPTRAERRKQARKSKKH